MIAKQNSQLDVKAKMVYVIMKCRRSLTLGHPLK